MGRSKARVGRSRRYRNEVKQTGLAQDLQQLEGRLGISMNLAFSGFNAEGVIEGLWCQAGTI
jgi:hypothetical protein